MPPDLTVVALLGPHSDARCTDPGCSEPDPCDDCYERRLLASGRADVLGYARWLRRQATGSTLLVGVARWHVYQLAALAECCAR